MGKERLLILGANGFVGQHILREFHLDPKDVESIRTYDLNTPFRKSLGELSSKMPPWSWTNPGPWQSTTRQ